MSLDVVPNVKLQLYCVALGLLPHHTGDSMLTQQGAGQHAEVGVASAGEHGGEHQTDRCILAGVGHPSAVHAYTEACACGHL